MVKKLSKADILAIKRLNRKEIARPFITYNKNGRVVRHKTLATAIISAKVQSLLGRRGFVDKDEGKFTRSVKVFEPKRKKVKRRKR